MINCYQEIEKTKTFNITLCGDLMGILQFSELRVLKKMAGYLKDLLGMQYNNCRHVVILDSAFILSFFSFLQ